MPKKVSIRKFAEILGVSHVAVIKAIKAGRIFKDADGKLDLEASRQAWADNTDQSKRREPPLADPTPPPAGDPSSTGQEKKPENKTAKAYAVARAVKEEFAARKMRLEFEEKAKSLISAADQKREAFKAGRIIRDTVMNLPNKISHELAAETDPDKVHAKLSKALHSMLDALFTQGKVAATSDEDEDEDDFHNG